MARTHCSINAFILAVIAILTIGLTTACENTARGIKQDTAEAEAETRDERAQAAAAARDLAHDAVQTGRAVGSLAADAGEELAERTGAVAHAARLKGALMADTTIDASRVDVDLNGETRTITLNGQVRSAAERERAEALAREKADGYAIANNLVIQPR